MAEQWANIERTEIANTMIYCVYIYWILFISVCTFGITEKYHRQTKLDNWGTIKNVFNNYQHVLCFLAVILIAYLRLSSGFPRIFCEIVSTEVIFHNWWHKKIVSLLPTELFSLLCLLSLPMHPSSDTSFSCNVQASCFFYYVSAFLLFSYYN